MPDMLSTFSALELVSFKGIEAHGARDRVLKSVARGKIKHGLKCDGTLRIELSAGVIRHIGNELHLEIESAQLQLFPFSSSLFTYRIPDHVSFRGSSCQTGLHSQIMRSKSDTSASPDLQG